MSHYFSARHALSFVFAILISITVLTGHVNGQNTNEPSETPTPAPAPVDEETEKLKLEKERALLRQAIAEAEKAELAAKYPKPSTTPLAGKTEVDAGVKIESEMMAYLALRALATDMVADIHKRQPSIRQVAVLDPQALKGIQGYSATTVQLKMMAEGYRKILEHPNRNGGGQKILEHPNQTGGTQKMMMLGALPAAASLVGAFVDLIAFMRTDTTVNGMSYTVDDSILVSEVYRAMKEKYGEASMYFPEKYPPNVVAETEYVILKQIEDLNDLKVASEQIVSAIEETEKKLKEEQGTKEKLEERGKQLPKLIAAAKQDLAKDQKVYKNHRSAELMEKIENLKNQIEKLEKERSVELPKSIAANAAAILALEAKLAGLYDELQGGQIPLLILAIGYERIGNTLSETSHKFLGSMREFTTDELELLLAHNEDAQKKLVAEAEAYKKAKLTDVESDKLLHPVDADRIQLYLELRNKIEGGKNIDDLLKAGSLTVHQQLILKFDTDAEVAVNEKLVNKQKGPLVIRLKALNAQFEKFYQDVIKVDAATGFNPITSHIQTENLLNAMGCKNGECDESFMLELSVIDAGGNKRTKTNLITNLFTGADITHSGGAIAQYKLYDMNGRIVGSNVCQAYEHYRKPKSITAMQVVKAPKQGQTIARCGESFAPPVMRAGQ